MKAAEHNAPVRNDFLSEKLSGLTIPWRRIAFYVTMALGFFLLGFVPIWFTANRAIEQRDAAQREVRLMQFESTLGGAMIDVQRSEYERARQTMSDFYTSLRGQIDAGPTSAFNPAQREQLRPLLAERDEIITLLARSDPSAADRLLAIYSSYRSARK